jgi:hypothetical protein
MFSPKMLSMFSSQVAQKMQDKPAQPAPAPAKGIMGRMASRAAEQIKNQPAPAPASSPAPTKGAMRGIAKRLGRMKFQEGGEVGEMDEMEMMRRKGRGMAKADMQTNMKSGGMMKGYAAGGMPMVEKDGKKVPAFAADGKGKMKSGGIASSLKAHASAPASKAHGKKKMMGGGMAKYAKGGKVDGCAQRGKTKGRMV